MSWGIAETASEIEKIKSESACYLNGLNSCGVIDWYTYDYAFDFYADLLMKAYEQGGKDGQPEPCEDAVSRADVEIAIANLLRGVFVEYQDIAKKAASKLPSVQLEQRWIPCSERLPKEPTKVLCCRTNNSIAIMHFNPILTTRYPKGFSIIDSDGFSWRQDNVVIAWMPLPEAYREEGDRE